MRDVDDLIDRFRYHQEAVKEAKAELRAVTGELVEAIIDLPFGKAYRAGLVKFNFSTQDMPKGYIESLMK